MHIIYPRCGGGEREREKERERVGAAGEMRGVISKNSVNRDAAAAAAAAAVVVLSRDRIFELDLPPLPT